LFDTFLIPSRVCGGGGGGPVRSPVVRVEAGGGGGGGGGGAEASPDSRRRGCRDREQSDSSAHEPRLSLVDCSRDARLMSDESLARALVVRRGGVRSPNEPAACQRCGLVVL